MKGKIFNTEEVQAIIAGNKTMFREVVKEIGNIKLNSGGAGLYFGKCPYQIGQKIFCKESARSTHETKGGLNPWYGVTYKAGGDKSFYGEKAEPNFPDSIFKNNGELRFAPAKSMPQWASRLTLLIKEIKVERLASISEEDCLKEGVYKTKEPNPFSGRNYRACEGKNFVEPLSTWHYSAQDAFQELWNATHKKPEEKFEASPFVWCVNFEVINN